jgi:hypothetical protein
VDRSRVGIHDDWRAPRPFGRAFEFRALVEAPVSRADHAEGDARSFWRSGTTTAWLLANTATSATVFCFTGSWRAGGAVAACGWPRQRPRSSTFAAAGFRLPESSSIMARRWARRASPKRSGAAARWRLLGWPSRRLSTGRARTCIGRHAAALRGGHETPPFPMAKQLSRHGRAGLSTLVRSERQHGPCSDARSRTESGRAAVRCLKVPPPLSAAPGERPRSEVLRTALRSLARVFVLLRGLW